MVTLNASNLYTVGLLAAGETIAGNATTASTPVQKVAQRTSELTTYQFERLAEADDPRLVMGILAASAAAYLAFVTWQYWRERNGLPRGMGVLLTVLRLVAFAGAILFYLKPVKRTDQQTTVESQVAVLIDTSQSMAVEDELFGDLGKVTRSRAAAELLAQTDLLEQLRAENRVSVRGFDSKARRMAEWPRTTLSEREANTDSADETTLETDLSDDEQSAEPDWVELLEPAGTKTSLGDAIAEALADSTAGPLAGIVLLSDGRQNTGIDPQELVELSKQERVPIYTIGVGSTKSRRNLRVQDLLAPSRAYPDDKTKVRAVIQAEGFRDRSTTVTLHARSGADGSPFTQIGQQELSPAADEQVETLEFEIEPTELGRMELEVRIEAPSDDQYASDNRRTVELEIVETSTRVLLIASGATREYRFLRNQLQRDKHTTVDVWLQLSDRGISQDADEILESFPADRKTLFEYDCIVAFDPDWTMLEAQQVDMLEAWVAEEAGGMIAVAGPVHTSAWLQSAEHVKIRGLYPVEFQSRLTFLDDGQYGSTSPWPLAFTRAGEEAEFFMLADTPEASAAAWEDFPGVFGCYAVKGPKPGAQVYARYSDPDASITADFPVYIAEQFYGAGRVLYLGSGEMWRLRGRDPGYFEVLYTQLIRHVSQGRLQRGSSRGMLLVQRDRYSVGDDVTIRAQLRTAAQEPYLAERVTMRATGPKGEGTNVVLTADPKRPGNFLGQTTVTEEGSYRFSLSAPDAVDEQLTRRVQVVLPDLEFEQTQRDASLLSSLAQQTGGSYYRSPMQAVEGFESLRPLGRAIPSRAETEVLNGQPEKQFTERIHFTLLGVICGALGLEWFLRRLMKLA